MLSWRCQPGTNSWMLGGPWLWRLSSLNLSPWTHHQPGHLPVPPRTAWPPCCGVSCSPDRSAAIPGPTAASSRPPVRQHWSPAGAAVGRAGQHRHLVRRGWDSAWSWVFLSTGSRRGDAVNFRTAWLDLKSCLSSGAEQLSISTLIDTFSHVHPVPHSPL